MLESENKSLVIRDWTEANALIRLFKDAQITRSPFIVYGPTAWPTQIVGEAINHWYEFQEIVGKQLESVTHLTEYHRSMREYLRNKTYRLKQLVDSQSTKNQSLKLQSALAYYKFQNQKNSQGFQSLNHLVQNLSDSLQADLITEITKITHNPKLSAEIVYQQAHNIKQIASYSMQVNLDTPKAAYTKAWGLLANRNDLNLSRLIQQTPDDDVEIKSANFESQTSTADRDNLLKLKQQSSVYADRDRAEYILAQALDQNKASYDLHDAHLIARQTLNLIEARNLSNQGILTSADEVRNFLTRTTQANSNFIPPKAVKLLINHAPDGLYETLAGYSLHFTHIDLPAKLVQKSISVETSQQLINQITATLTASGLNSQDVSLYVQDISAQISKLPTQDFSKSFTNIVSSPELGLPKHASDAILHTPVIINEVSNIGSEINNPNNPLSPLSSNNNQPAFITAQDFLSSPGNTNDIQASLNLIIHIDAYNSPSDLVLEVLSNPDSFLIPHQARKTALTANMEAWEHAIAEAASGNYSEINRLLTIPNPHQDSTESNLSRALEYNLTHPVIDAPPHHPPTTSFQKPPSTFRQFFSNLQIQIRSYLTQLQSQLTSWFAQIRNAFTSSPGQPGSGPLRQIVNGLSHGLSSFLGKNGPLSKGLGWLKNLLGNVLNKKALGALAQKLAALSLPVPGNIMFWVGLGVIAILLLSALYFIISPSSTINISSFRYTPLGSGRGGGGGPSEPYTGPLVVFQLQGGVCWPTTGCMRGYMPEYHPTIGNNGSAIDIGNVIGTPVIAPMAGTILFAGWDDSGYGNHVRMSVTLPLASGGAQSCTLIFGHFAQVTVPNGIDVVMGTQLGLMDDTGNSDGSHLHYEVLCSGVRGNIRDLFPTPDRNIQQNQCIVNQCIDDKGDPYNPSTNP